MSNSEDNKLAVFQGKHIRKVFYEGEWWFSIIDVIEILTDSSIPKRYWSDLKRKLANEGYSELYEKIVQLKFAAADGKLYATDCANTETMFHIIQSIPSPLRTQADSPRRKGRENFGYPAVWPKAPTIGCGGEFHWSKNA